MNILTKASHAVEDAMASDDNHPDDIARAVLLAVLKVADEYGEAEFRFVKYILEGGD